MPLKSLTWFRAHGHLPADLAHLLAEPWEGPLQRAALGGSALGVDAEEGVAELGPERMRSKNSTLGFQIRAIRRMVGHDLRRVSKRSIWNLIMIGRTVVCTTAMASGQS